MSNEKQKFLQRLKDIENANAAETARLHAIDAAARDLVEQTQQWA